MNAGRLRPAFAAAALAMAPAAASGCGEDDGTREAASAATSRGDPATDKLAQVLARGTLVGLTAAAKGKIDAFLAAEPAGRAQIGKGLALRRLPEVPFTYFPSGFVDKSSGLDSAAFVARVNQIIRSAQEDGSLERPSRRFLNRDYIAEASAYDIEALEQDVR